MTTGASLDGLILNQGIDDMQVPAVWLLEVRLLRKEGVVKTAADLTTDGFAELQW